MTRSPPSTNAGAARPSSWINGSPRQAAAPRADSLARVAALRAHPDFDIKNPNRIRSLAASFATRNPRAFHAADGSGYAFLAKLAGEVDPLNPALAARLLGPFENWRRFDKGRQEKARAALQRWRIGRISRRTRARLSNARLLDSATE